MIEKRGKKAKIINWSVSVSYALWYNLRDIRFYHSTFSTLVTEKFAQGKRATLHFCIFFFFKANHCITQFVFALTHTHTLTQQHKTSVVVSLNFKAIRWKLYTGIKFLRDSLMGSNSSSLKWWRKLHKIITFIYSHKKTVQDREREKKKHRLSSISTWFFFENV